MHGIDAEVDGHCGFDSLRAQEGVAVPEAGHGRGEHVVSASGEMSEAEQHCGDQEREGRCQRGAGADAGELVLNEAPEEGFFREAREEQVDGREPQEQGGPLWYSIRYVLFLGYY